MHTYINYGGRDGHLRFIRVLRDLHVLSDSTHTQIHAHRQMYMYTQTHTHMHTHIHCICKRTHTNTHMHTHTHRHTYSNAHAQVTEKTFQEMYINVGMANCEKRPKQERDDIRFTHIAIPTSFYILFVILKCVFCWNMYQFHTQVVCATYGCWKQASARWESSERLCWMMPIVES